MKVFPPKEVVHMPAVTTQLEPMLTGLVSKQPQVRDDWAYAGLAEGIAAGRWADEADLIRERMVAYLRTGKVWTKSFAALVLNCLAEADHFDYEDYLVFRDWYVTEPDTRGYDEQLGWIHAVAHGADYLETCVRKGYVPAVEVAAVISCRLRAPGGEWVNGEGWRLARATCSTIAHASSPHLLEVWSRRLGKAVMEEAESGENPVVVWNFAAFLGAIADMVREEPAAWEITDDQAQLILPLIDRLQQDLEPYVRQQAA